MLDKLPRCGKRLCFVHSRLSLAWARHAYVQLVIFIPYAPMDTHHGSTPQSGTACMSSVSSVVGTAEQRSKVNTPIQLNQRECVPEATNVR